MLLLNLKMPCSAPAVILTLVAVLYTANDLSAADLKPTRDEFAAPSKPYSPFVGDHFPQQVYFGDTHLHTSWSTDAGLVGATATPDDAYRVARGETIQSQTGGPIKLVKPLDFLVVADHAENIGLKDYIDRSDPTLLASEVGRRWHDMIKSGRGYDAFLELLTYDAKNEDPIKSPEMVSRSWQRVIDNAESYYQPGVFTTFIGYEWTSQPGGNNLHRVIMFRDGAVRTSRVLPFSLYDSTDPEDLWDYMRAYEANTGGQVLAIPHNGNLSNGMMFMTETHSGKKFDREYALARRAFEPVVEVTQPKGTGEAHPFLSPDDAFADFGLIDVSNLDGSVAKTKEMLRTEYAREALKLGLREEQRIGVNPFQFGMIGSTDAHNAIPSTREENWFGKAYIVEPSAHRYEDVLIESPIDPSLSIKAVDLGASGLAAVWATENTRESIWDAFSRREVYATTGSRLVVRVFAGWDFEADEVHRPDFARQGYLRGVPMGAEMVGAGDVPRFMVRALRDADGANIDRVQVIKGWLDERGRMQERIFDIACSDGRQIVEGRCDGNVGNTVDLASATYTNTVGEPYFAAYWTDSNFDPDQPAFYYVRVIEIRTPNWLAHDAVKFGVTMPEGTPLVVQDRAYTSPIWYRPK